MTDNECSNPNQKQGVINKCPACGGQLKAFATRCDLCGHELAGVGASRAVTDLVQKFSDLEGSLAASGLSGKKLETELIARRARLIRDFPIPNAREDLQSLIYFIHPKIQDNIKPDPNAEDWRVKFKEVLNLAKNAYKSDAKTRQEFEDIERSLNISLTGVLQNRARRSPLIAAGVAVVAVLVIAGVISTQWDEWKLRKCEEKYAQGAAAEKARLDGVSATASTKLQAKDYSGALSTLNDLRWEYQETCKGDDAAQQKSTWDAKRQELVAVVKNAEAAVLEQQRELAQREADQKRLEAEQEAAQKREVAEREAAQKREIAEREAAQKRAVAERAESRRIADAERDLSDRIRQRAARRTTGE